MAKSNYISGLLFIGAVLVLNSIGSFCVDRDQVAGIRYQDPVRVSKYRKGTIDDRSEYLLKKALVKQVYDSQIGVRESGVNNGVQVEKYLGYAGLAKGNPWCAAFVCWVFGQAGVDNPKTGWSPSLFPADKLIWREEAMRKGVKGESGKLKAERGKLKAERGKLKGESSGCFACLTTGNEQPATPNTGDVFGLYFPEKGRIAHAGFIDQWDGDWLITVEGNTNTSGGREGDGVYRKRRAARSIYRVARYIR